MAIVVERDGALVAAGAFGLYRPAGSVGPTFARWLGDHRQWFSPELLVDPEMTAAGETVMDALLGLADVVHLPAAAHGAAYAALRARVPWLTELPGAQGWIVPVQPPRMEEALTRFRRDCRRAARRGAEVTLRLASSPDEVSVALERLLRPPRRALAHARRRDSALLHHGGASGLVSARGRGDGRKPRRPDRRGQGGRRAVRDRHGVRRRARRCHAHDGGSSRRKARRARSRTPAALVPRARGGRCSGDRHGLGRRRPGESEGGARPDPRRREAPSRCRLPEVPACAWPPL